MSQIGALVGGLWGDAGENFVNEQGGAAKVFGTKPEVAPYKTLDLGQEIGRGVGFNLENLPAISSLLNKIIPGFSDMLGAGQENLAQVFANAQANLRGELTPEEIGNIQRSSAQQSLQGGYGGTGMAKALTARDIGQTTEQKQLQGAQLSALGANTAQQWAKLAEEAFSPFVVSTGQTAGTTAANLAGQREAQQMQFNVNAAPDPGALGIFNVDAALGQQMLSFGMAAAGGGIGGGGGGGATAQYMGTGSAQAPAAGYGGYNYTATDRAIAQTPLAQNYFNYPTWGG